MIKFSISSSQKFELKLVRTTSVILENNILKADYNSRLFLLLQNQHDILPDLVRTGGIHSTRSVWR